MRDGVNIPMVKIRKKKIENRKQTNSPTKLALGSNMSVCRLGEMELIGARKNEGRLKAPNRMVVIFSA